MTPQQFWKIYHYVGHLYCTDIQYIQGKVIDHKSNFKPRNPQNVTALSSYIWKLHNDVTWQIFSRLLPFTPASEVCRLCIKDKYQLDCNPSQVQAKSNLRLVASLLLHSQLFFSSSSSTLIGPIQMLISQSILNRFGSNFGFYISWPILAKYMIPLQISTTQNLN